MLNAHEHINYFFEFTDTFLNAQNVHIAEREVKCLSVMARRIWGGVDKDSIIAGRFFPLCAGFSPQEAGDMGYYFDSAVFDKLCECAAPELKEKMRARAKDYIRLTTAERLRCAVPESIRKFVPNDDKYFDTSGAAFCLYRMSGTHLDFKKLISLGIPGLKALINKKSKANPSEFYDGMLAALNVLNDSILLNAAYAEKAGNQKLKNTLINLTVQAPKDIAEALNLVNIYVILSGTRNYGRMDDYLSGFPIDADSESAIEDFFKRIADRNCPYDGRVIVGGKGRENEEQADRIALIALKASERLRNPLPQLTLRFYDSQNPLLLKTAFDNFEKAWIYPMLYRDEINIPAVQKAFGVSAQTAQNYIPFGCGEYIINHASVGTPSCLINLAQIVIDTLKKQDYNSFDEFFSGYKQLTEEYVSALAAFEALEYRHAAETAPYLLLSALYDDCIEKGKAIFDGGVHILGGTLESYGNTNAADSLTAVKETVFEKKLFTQNQLREFLQADFEGYEHERRVLIEVAKYGNDDEKADWTAAAVHEHICSYTKSCAKSAELDSYLIVVINNNANSLLGLNTGATPDGRKKGEPLANANNPSGGSDISGITAMLNSLVKLDNTIHAGAVQNLKVSKEMTSVHRDKFEALLKTYFQKGQQIMLNILSKEDLQNALKNPEKYANLVVRVGGFSARFVELDNATKKDILSRTLY